MNMITVAFCERERDLAKMTILHDGDRLIARFRRSDDRIEPSFQTGEFNDLWIHVRSNGRYIRHDHVHDVEDGVDCYDYSSFEDGRLWLRAVAAWEEVVEGKPRFVPLR